MCPFQPAETRHRSVAGVRCSACLLGPARFCYYCCIIHEARDARLAASVCYCYLTLSCVQWADMPTL